MPPGREPAPGGVRRDRRKTQPKSAKPKKPPQLPLLPGMVDPATGKVVMPFDQWKPTPKPKPNEARRRREVVRRQQLLRNAGYKIVVDGTWGPRSQRAWQHYLKHRSVVFIKKPQDHLDLTNPKAAPTPQQDAQELAAARRVTQQQERDAAIKRKKEAERQAVLKRAAELRTNPQAARRMSLNDLTAVLIDKEVNFDARKDKNLVKALQEHLRSRGYKVNPNGIFGRITYRALKKEQRKQIVAEQAKGLDVIRRRLFDTGIVKVGEQPPWWGFGPMPTPQKLLKIFQEGGPTAQLMFDALAAQASTPEAAWTDVRAVQLNSMAQNLMPMGAAAIQARIAGPESVPLWQYMMDLYSVTDLAPFGDYSAEAGFTEEERLKALQVRSGNRKVKEANAAAVGALHAQVGALLGANNPKELKVKFAALAAEEEKKFKAFQQKLASQDVGFFGKTVSAIFWPGEQLRNVMVAASMNLGQAFSAIPSGTAPHGREVQVYTPNDAEAEIATWNPLIQFAFEAAVDPINFIAPARLASTGVALLAGERAVQLGRYVRTGEGASKAIIYTKGTWQKRAVIRAPFELLVGKAEVARFIEQPFVRRTEELMRRLSKTNNEMLGAVSERVRHAARLGWKVPSFKVPGETYVVPKHVGQARQLLDKSDAEWAQFLQKSNVLKLFIEEMKRVGGSMHLRYDRTRELTQYGAAFTAHLAESMRPMKAAKLALDVADNAYQAVIDRAAGEASDALKAEALAASQKAYEQTLRGFGHFLAGGSDKSLREVDFLTRKKDELGNVIPGAFSHTTRDLIAELDGDMKVLMEEVERSLIPAIQDELERHANATFQAAQAAAKKQGDAIRAQGTPGVTSGSETDFLRYPDHGEPGIHMVRLRNAVAAVFRDESGAVQAHAMVGDNSSLHAFTAPAFRRRGIQSRLYDYLEAHGVPVKSLSGKGPMTKEGADFAAARVEKAAADHPLWDEQGIWRGRHAAEEGGITDLVRKSFDDAEMPSVHNPQHGHSYTDVGMRAAVESELRRRLFRVNDYAARKVAGDMIPLEDRKFAAMAHDAREAAIEAEVHKAWSQGKDGFWYDNRATVKVSNLYARGMEELAKKQLVVDSNGELDMLATLSTNQPFDKMTRLEIDMRDLAAMMTGVYAQKLPGTEMRILGIHGGIHEEAGALRDLIDKRMMALGEVEKSSVPKLMLEQGAVWRAFQHAQSRKLALAYKGLNAQLILWKFATLALRPAWAIRNFIDNIAKAIIAGCRDPRLFIVGPGQSIGHALDQGIGQLRDFMVWADTMYGTNATKFFDDIVHAVWEIPSQQLSKIFGSLMVEVPPEVFEMNLRQDIMNGKAVGLKLTSQPSLERQAALHPTEFRNVGAVEGAVDKSLSGLEDVGKRFGKVAFHIVGNIPENYARRIVYRSTFKKAQRELALDAGLTSVQVNLKATDAAIKAVEDTLFDYSQISVIEDNLKIFLPFIQFWRRNSVFWAKSFATKPWLNNSILHFDQDRRDAHVDTPNWMKRYFHTDEIADALAVVPGLDEAFQKLGLGDGAMFDPISLTSMAPFYRAFKSENQFLPTDRPGLPIISGLIDGLNDWGLGMNPMFRKPLENLGVANYRSWQSIFPQTAIADALADYYGVDAISRIAHSMEFIGSLPGSLTNFAKPDDIASNKDYWVQTVVAEQVARGEQPDIAKAEQTVKDWFVTLNLWGYFGGIYWRRATPEDMYLAKLQDDVIKGERNYDSLTDAEKEQLHIWDMRGYDRLTYDRYIGLLPVIDAYYRADFEGKDEIKKANPEIIRWVDGDFNGRPVSSKFVRYAARYVEQERFFDAVELADTLDVAPDVRAAAEAYFLSPELKAFWKKNETPSRTRDRMVQAEVREYFHNLNKAYFAIPESDFQARDQFMSDHPELVRHNAINNDPSEDYGAILGHVRADLRDTYFSIVEAHGGDDKGFAAAAGFLKMFPYIFEGTKSASKIQNGEWIPGHGKWSAARIADYRAAKTHLQWFFEEFMPKVGEKKAWAWLEKTETENGTVVRDYLNKYPSSKRLEYLKAQPWLKVYFGLPPKERGAWLRGDTEGAKIVLAFFKKYGDQQSQHAKDYLAAKKDMDYYFSLPEETRSKWLNSHDPRAVKVKAYFKKYGKQHQFERAFKKLIAKYPELANGTPEQVQRMNFWKQYFHLPPDQRPMFVLNEADKHGVFIYGEFGEKYTHDREQEYMRRAVDLELSKRQAAYLYVRPLLNFYRTLNPDEKILFAKANPELNWYFDSFSHKSVTGDKKLDVKVEGYFKLPPDSLARSAYLRHHPEVQDWFDKRSSPAEKAMRNVLEQYFSLTPFDRPDFLARHPEIPAYFEARRREKDSERQQLAAFDHADPRLAPFFEDSADLERAAALMRKKLANRVLKAYGVTTRRDRLVA